MKFNEAEIKLDLKEIILTKKSHISGIFPVTNHNANSISLKGITKKKLLPKKKYLAQRAKVPILLFYAS